MRELIVKYLALGCELHFDTNNDHDGVVNVWLIERFTHKTVITPISRQLFADESYSVYIGMALDVAHKKITGELKDGE